MKFDVEYSPSFAWLRVQLEPNETLKAEAGSMVMKTPTLGMSTRLNSGYGASFWDKFLAFFAALARKFLGGETMFINEFGDPAGGEVVLAPRLPGNITHRRITAGQRLFVQGGSYLASTGPLKMKLRFAGLRGLLGGAGLFFLEFSGEGDLFINSYGGIVEIPVRGSYIVDTGHMVAFDGTLDFKVRGSGGVTQTLFSGEGLTLQLQGNGNVYVQSRNINALVSSLTPFLRG